MARLLDQIVYHTSRRLFDFSQDPKNWSGHQVLSNNVKNFAHSFPAQAQCKAIRHPNRSATIGIWEFDPEPQNRPQYRNQRCVISLSSSRTDGCFIRSWSTLVSSRASAITGLLWCDVAVPSCLSTGPNPLDDMFPVLHLSIARPVKKTN